MKILKRIKWFIYDYLPATKGELMKLDEMFLELIEATQEHELLMRNDLRLMFNEMNKSNDKKPVKKSKNGIGNMYG